MYWLSTQGSPKLLRKSPFRCSTTQVFVGPTIVDYAIRDPSVVMAALAVLTLVAGVSLP